MSTQLNSAEERVVEYLCQQGLDPLEARIFTIIVTRQYRTSLEELVDILQLYDEIEQLPADRIEELIHSLIQEQLLYFVEGKYDRYIEARDPISNISRSLLQGAQLDSDIAETIEEKVDLFRGVSLREKDLIERVGWASWESARGSLKEAINEARVSIKLGVFSSKTVYPAIYEEIEDALRKGIDVRILMFSPNLARQIEPDVSVRDIVERTRDWTQLCVRERELARQEGRDIGKLEVRWLDNPGLSAIHRASIIDERWWILNIHSPGAERGIEGIVYRGRGDKWGRTTIFNLLNYYWNRAWEQSYSPTLSGRIQASLRKGIWGDMLVVSVLAGICLYLKAVLNQEFWSGGFLGAAVQKTVEVLPALRKNTGQFLHRLSHTLMGYQEHGSSAIS